MNRHENLHHEHLSDDRLIGALYGLDDIGRETAACAECGSRFERMRSVRQSLAATPEPSIDLLAAQRRRIYERIEHPDRGRRAWLPALATAACLMVAGVVVYHPRQSTLVPQQPQRPEISDTQLYSDVYSIEQSDEPTAAAPIHELFEADGSN